MVAKALLCLVFLGFSFLASVPAVLAEGRVAFVVGNNLYSNLGKDQQLERAVNDARAVGDALIGDGFEVIRGENLTRSELNSKFFEFIHRIQPGDLAFFYFAGHGVAIDGGNFILPSDVPAPRAGDEKLIAAQSIGEEDIIADLHEKGARVSILVLDACRNNPFRRPGLRSVGLDRGLARTPDVQGVFSIYSAGFGQTALDSLSDSDTDPNSVFTRVLVRLLTKPGLSLQDIAYEVREQVAALAETQRLEQVPATYDQTLHGRIYLKSPPETAKADQLASAPPACSAAQSDFLSADAAGDAAALLLSAERFPDCPYAAVARIRAQQLQARVVAVAAAPAGDPKATDSPGDVCDRLAGPRVRLEQIDSPRAVEACEAAAKVLDDDSWTFDLARSYEAGGKFEAAAHAYRVAFGLGNRESPRKLLELWSNDKISADNITEILSWLSYDPSVAPRKKMVRIANDFYRNRDYDEAKRWYEAVAGHALDSTTIWDLNRKYQ
ncbi:caspase family protein [Labrys wisconsinensis]|uniref:Caspase-like protein n=1 Tax=Labrys wisconsinensis TaxID=425677 RepID=A0ABU0JAM8_9HYPH|nr:caspase family protein [Labrys wisconsinensis]MDQ0471323.1 putative caspase-like protein [Labrys wisconsinensis]